MIFVGLESFDTARKDVIRATCFACHGSASTTVVIFGNAFLFITVGYLFKAKIIQKTCMHK